MKIVLQRVSRASVKVDDIIVGSIDHGMLLLLGFSSNDTEESILPTILESTFTEALDTR